MSFLPKGYEAPKTESGYMKLVEGKNAFRILSDAIIGYQYWTEEDGKRKPVRVRTADQTPPPYRPKMKHFWAMIVWNYTDEQIQILEITQSTIRDSIVALWEDESWGDPKEYDLTITRQGKDLETTYQVMPRPAKAVSPEVVEALNDKKINLEALYDGGNPFEKEDEIPFS